MPILSQKSPNLSFVMYLCRREGLLFSTNVQYSALIGQQLMHRTICQRTNLLQDGGSNNFGPAELGLKLSEEVLVKASNQNAPSVTIKTNEIIKLPIKPLILKKKEFVTASKCRNFYLLN